MRFRNMPVLTLVLALAVSMGCAKKVDPKRPLEKIQSDVISMSVADLESHASAYAAAIRAQKAEITKIQQQVRKIPIEKFFNNKTMTHKISNIGREAEALLERYQIYIKALQEKGGDLTKVRIEPA